MSGTALFGTTGAAEEAWLQYKKYLPLTMYKNNNINVQMTAPGSIQCLLDTSDQGSGYVNDYWAALVEGYRAYLQCLTQWANEMGLQYYFQVSYNMSLDALASISEVNTPDPLTKTC
ncbi:hypothetical protein BDV23DRAFT_181570 [Aspergillus alliaceus]|uniref:Uncharacterized protein n=1 Tax=Petromyces alliaceus TaxID=209559 RepID=A0A5N7CEV3_PETAA|nr:hypothetical protein BDV23DRAFT_181570 [Aspergillus alliaceus]